MRCVGMGEEPIEFGFKYHRLSPREKGALLDRLRRELMGMEDIVFAYVHGGFVERDEFRDVDVAIWIRDPEKAFYYTVDFSAKLEIKFKLPIDVHVLNEAPLSFKYHVFTKGVLLFSKDEDFRRRKLDEVVRKYIDLKQLEKYASRRGLRGTCQH